jgi:hypothetical protein
VKYLRLYIFIGCVFFFLFLTWLFCLNHISVNTIGVVYNSLNGEVNIQERPGWYVTSPLVRVVQISTVPMLVHIPSDAKVITQKLVRFKPEGTMAFIEMQGFSYSLGSQLENILLGYAFSGKPFTFLEILQEGHVNAASK